MFATLFGAVFFLALACILPGLGIVKVLDPTADKWRKWMLAPALGLLFAYGAAGLSVVLLGRFSGFIFLTYILCANVAGYKLSTVESKRRERPLSTWEALGQAMGHTEQEGIGESLVGVWDDETWIEVAEQKAIHSARQNWWLVPVAAAVLVSLLPLFIFRFPQGVDWVGFASLSHSFASTGTLDLPTPSEGYWTYPPGFPALAAFLQGATGMAPDIACHILGRISLLFLLLGVAGACDRWGAGVSTLVAMGLAAGLFAKAHDSGWPTMASQLGLVLGLLVVIRPAGSRQSYHDFFFALGVISVAVIHPTGAMYLGTLLLANVLVRRLQSGEDQRAIHIIAISGVMLAIAAAITFLAFAPRLLEADIFAEYGWQGGWPMLIYTSPLLPLALWAGWKLRGTVEGSILLLWLGLQWLLTLVHLLDGLSIPVLSLLSFTLYSMGLHAFHIPAAALLGMGMAKGSSLKPLERDTDLSTASILEAQASSDLEEGNNGNDEDDEGEGEGDDVDYLALPSTRGGPTDSTDDEWRLPQRWATSICLTALLLLAGSQLAMLKMAEHPELLVTTQADRDIVARLAEHVDSGSIIYVENAHWGYIFDLPEDIGVTSFPSLGLVHLEESIQSEATKAIRNDDVQTLRELGISHVITSPLGGLIWEIHTSPWWKQVDRQGGARLFELRAQLQPESEGWFTTPAEQDCESSPTCDWRVDAWAEQRNWQQDGFSDHRAFISQGSLTWNATPYSNLVGRVNDLNFLLEGSADIVVRVSLRQFDDAGQQSWLWSQRTSTESGWVEVNSEIDGLQNRPLEITVEVISGGGDIWLNPLGLSGRGDRTLDESGVRIHWLNLQPQIN